MIIFIILTGFAEIGFATDAELSFNHSSVTANVGQTITLIAQINPGTNEIGGVELDVNFDPDFLRLDSITKASVFNIVLDEPIINNTNGTGSIDVGLLTDPATYITDPSDIATFVFTTLSAVSNSAVSFDVTSNASAHGECVVSTRTESQITVNSVINNEDTIAPLVTAFSISANSSSLTVPITTLTATDSAGVTGYKLTETSVAPLASNSGWTVTAPGEYTFSSAGTKTLYAWAKDAAGNVSTSLSDDVTIILPEDNIVPIVTSFSIPNTSNSLNIAIETFIATDTAGVTGYMLTESSSAPLSIESDWDNNVPTSYTFSSAGTKTLYAWAKDAAGNISTSLSDSIVITIDEDEEEEKEEEETMDNSNAPIISDGSPSGRLSASTKTVNLSVNTNENATCKFSSDSNIEYDLMSNTFATTGTTKHLSDIGGISDDKNYDYYVRCKNSSENKNNIDYKISFSVKEKDFDDEKKKEKRKITNSQSSISRGQVLIQNGKRFSKNADVLIYFSKAGGGYYPPMKVKTSADGKFSVFYKVAKPAGKYNWYAVDTKTGRKSNLKSYTVK